MHRMVCLLRLILLLFLFPMLLVPSSFCCSCCLCFVQLLAGHEGPVSGVAFQPGSAELVSCSWDRTIKFWDVLDSQSARETRQLGSDGEYMCGRVWFPCAVLLLSDLLHCFLASVMGKNKRWVGIFAGEFQASW